MSGGRLGTPAFPPAGSEPHSCHSLCRDPLQVGWEARRLESGLTSDAIFAYLQEIFKRKEDMTVSLPVVDN